MNEKPIGIFDSGLGGLTVVRELVKALPRENLIYFGDTARMPYGTRSRSMIERYAKQDTDFLLQFGVKMIIAACGTVSSVATEVTRRLPVPFVGVITPAAKAAAASTKTGKIGVLGTNATISSGAFQREIRAYLPQAQIFVQPAPMLVQLVENGWSGSSDRIAELTVSRYLAPFLEQEIDTVILGCTHFPLLSPLIQKVMGEGVRLIDTGYEAAHRAKEVLAVQGLCNNSAEKGARRFYVSDKVQNFSQVVDALIGGTIKNEVAFADLSAEMGQAGEQIENTSFIKDYRHTTGGGSNG